MLGTSWQPVAAHHGGNAAAAEPAMRGNHGSRLHASSVSAIAGDDSRGRRYLPLLRVHRAIRAWWLRAQQRRVVVLLDERMLRDVGLPPDGERTVYSVPFRLPRQF